MVGPPHGRRPRRCLVWTFGLVHLVIGYASVMAAGFAIYFGLGIDHAAHLPCGLIASCAQDERVMRRSG